MKFIAKYKNLFELKIQKIQNKIYENILKYENISNIHMKSWDKNELGNGIMMYVDQGEHLEKYGAGISFITYILNDKLKKIIHAPENAYKIYACGISIISHPKNPFAPSFHANARMIILYDKNDQIIDCWFGGGSDLTPYYLFEQDAVDFHLSLKKSCDIYDKDAYEKYKQECDEYFYISHRAEHRGIGGIFFDKINPTIYNIEKINDFTDHLIDSYNDVYFNIFEKRYQNQYSQDDVKWQQIRRGRYVEFNLCYDRGTLFGLHTNGIIENILVSLPKHVQWVYDYKPTRDEHIKLMNVLKNPRDWI